MATANAKRVYIPTEGDFLTDETRLVEVLEKCREGYRVLDVTVPAEVGREERDPRATEIITAEALHEQWRQVVPEEDG